MKTSLLALMLSGLIVSAGAVNAQTSTPPLEWSDWSMMNPGSFLIDIDDIDNRCLTGAAVTSVTEAECQDAKNMLQTGQCRYEPIPDGTRYEFLMGLRDGEPHAYLNMVKRLGVSRMAFVCQVSTGRIIDWYAGEDGKSCGNVAARPNHRPVKTEPDVPPLPQYEEVVVCEPSVTIQTGSPGMTWSTLGTINEGCCCGQTQFIPGLTTTYSGTRGSYTIPGSCKVVKREIK